MSTQVTYKDVYDLLERLETKIDNAIKERDGEIKKEIEKIKERVVVVEVFKTKVLTYASILGAFSSAVVTLLWDKITGK